MIPHWNEWATLSGVIISWVYCTSWGMLHTEHCLYIWARWCGMRQVRTGERWGEEFSQGQLQWWNTATRNCCFTWKPGYRNDMMNCKCVIQPSKPPLNIHYHEEMKMYEGWNFNFGNTLLDWIQELLEWHANAAGRMGPSPTYIHNGSRPSRNGHTQ